MYVGTYICRPKMPTDLSVLFIIIYPSHTLHHLRACTYLIKMYARIHYVYACILAILHLNMLIVVTVCIHRWCVVACVAIVA